MNGIDIQILDYFAELPVDINFIISPRADEIFNMPPLNISADQIVEKIEKLKMDGYLQDFKDGSGEDECGEVLALTMKGGVEWIRVFKPDWSRYILVESDLMGNNYKRYTISSLDREKLVRIVHDINVQLVDGYILGLVSPWNAMYWKSFNEGYRLECAVKSSIDRYLISTQEDWRLPLLSR